MQTCILGRGGKGLPQRTAGVEVRAPSASVVLSRARAHQTTLLLLRRVVLFFLHPADVLVHGQRWAL